MNENKEAKFMSRKLAFSPILELVSCHYSLAQDILSKRPKMAKYHSWLKYLAIYHYFGNI